MPSILSFRRRPESRQILDTDQARYDENGSLKNYDAYSAVHHPVA
ncbi:MAG: hypothetical protein ACKVE4_03640 [Dissulfuribacterales bacterium]